LRLIPGGRPRVLLRLATGSVLTLNARVV